MSRKTNKTSHVMDLLTNGASTETDTSVTEAVSGQEKKTADVQSHTVTPAKVTVVDEGSRNDRLSQEILGKLTEELEEEARQELKAQEADIRESKTEEAGGQASGTGNPQLLTQPADDQEPLTQESHSPQPDSQEPPADGLPREPAGPVEGSASGDSGDVSQTLESGLQANEEIPQPSSLEAPQGPEDVPEPAGSREEAPEALGDPDEGIQKASAQKSGKTGRASGKENPHPIIPQSQFGSRFQDKEYRFINVMEQLLMRQNLESVLTQYEVCTCPRCMSDVCALALTGLPPKYVVTSKDSISPLISYYENKYKISVLTELMKACNQVRQNPRHKVHKETE